MPRSRNAPQLGNSWVVHDDQESSDSSYSEEMIPKKEISGMSNTLSTPSATPRRRSSRTSTRASEEPDLIMPSIHEDSLNGSWCQGERSRNVEPRRRKSARHNQYSELRQSDQSLMQTDGTSSKNIKMSRSKKATSTPKSLALLKPVLAWIYDVAGGAMGALKTPISYLLAIYCLIGLFMILRNLITTSIYSALSPVCRIPGSSYLNLPMCQTGAPRRYGQEALDPPVEFDQLVKVQDQFESILEESAGGVSLPLDMKRSETSIRDLRTVIRYSNLHSKNELVFEFNGFIETAAIASYDLQKFNSHVGRGVDNILATARWTKRVLDGIAMQKESRGAISAFFTDKLLAPFQPLQFTDATILHQYTEHTHAVETEINRLIAEAQALLLVLRNLDDRLDVIHGIALRDNLHAQGSKQEVMFQLWTMLGGNRKALGKYDSQLRLLGQVNVYRQTAIAHVAGTMLKLQAMGAELEELRERVGVVGLLEGRKGLPLSVHIENIELGVERLEQRRIWARGVENEQMRKALAKDGGQGERKEISGA